MNFIHHWKAVTEKLLIDPRINSFHISLYTALFYQWNEERFPEQLSIVRGELMQDAKIGSKTTYTQCLKQLNEWGFIVYLPSHSRHIPSKVTFPTFGKTSGKTSGKSSGKTSGKTPVKEVVPSYKTLLNITKHSKQEKSNAHESALSDQVLKNEKLGFEEGGKRDAFSSLEPPTFSEERETEEELVSKEKLPVKRKKFSPPQKAETLSYFQELNSTAQEAEKFLNYYQSKGWQVGKSPMKDWQAAARNWILNAQKFKQENRSQYKPRVDRIHVDNSPDKNYAEPL